MVTIAYAGSMSTPQAISSLLKSEGKNHILLKHTLLQNIDTVCLFFSKRMSVVAYDELTKCQIMEVL